MDFMKRCFFYAFLAFGIFLCKAGSAFDYSLVPVHDLQAQALANVNRKNLLKDRRVLRK